MKLLENALHALMQEHHDDFAGSLLCLGIDISLESWSHQAVLDSARVGAASIMRFVLMPEGVSEAGLAYVRMIVRILNEGSYVKAMACIYGAYEMTNRVTPMGILQYTVHEKLLREYCRNLKKELEKHLSNI